MNPNVLQWDGAPGHYEVHYVSLTDPTSGIGFWIRYTMRAPLARAPECHLWFMAMNADGDVRLARKATFAIDRLVAEPDPFRLHLDESVLTDRGMAGSFDDVAWELSWTPTLPVAEHVHPLLQRARIARTVLCLPHPDLAVSGTVSFAGRTLELDGAKGGQAHLWGSKHGGRWTWAHCNDFADAQSRAPQPETYVDGVSVVVPRLGRDIGPSTPVVGRFLGEDFRSTSPARVLRNPSRFGLESWSFEARDGHRKIAGRVDAPHASLVGVTYDDPDGDQVWCYNSETASMRLTVLDRQSGTWRERAGLVADGRAHFEYAQRAPAEGVELLLR
ncbi:MAG TPA: hypothetical protein VD931_01195 [Baekduia sp.]|nr:hypothetical protein [Baekduia sp.]